MSAAAKHDLGPHTVEEWLAVDPPEDGSRLELIHGCFHISPPPTAMHQYMASRLARRVDDAAAAAGRGDLYTVPAAGAKISSVLRTGLIPDLMVVNVHPTEFDYGEPGHLELVVEVWSRGNRRSERSSKMTAYAAAGVPFFWAVETLDGGPEITAYELKAGAYREAVTAKPGNTATITASPVPVTLDPAVLVA